MELKALWAVASSVQKRVALMRTCAQTIRSARISKVVRRLKTLKVVNRKPQMRYPFRILAFRLKCLNLVEIR